MPVLQLSDGTKIAQQRAILRFVGKAGGLYPEDALSACRVDELMDVVDDAQTAINMVGHGLEAEAKMAARAEDASTGAFSATLAKIDAYIAAHGSGGHAVGSTLTIADLIISTTLSFIFSGFFDGVTTAALEPHANIHAVRKATMAEPRIAAWYADRAETASDFEKFLAAV
jgi:prostaglandin-H2 D-isomerase / glutathione transferase